MPAEILLRVFQIVGDPDAIGVRLDLTPWTDSRLSATRGFDSAALRQAQERAGMPIPLIDLLHQAASGDARLVIFHPNAALLDGLPLYF
jgi:hypothetical protein